MNQEMTIEALSELPQDTYCLIDVRDAVAFESGHISDAIHIPRDSLYSARLPQEKQLILYCKRGLHSAEAAENLSRLGYHATYLAGGYLAWQEHKGSSICRAAEIERSLHKKFHRSIWSRFAKAVAEYQLVNEGDYIAVCISGGKDSMLMAKLFQELKRHNKVSFDLEFLVMDPGYHPENRKMIEKNAEIMAIPIQIFETRIFDSVYHVKNNPCYLCASMRRGHLYHQAKELGCNKIALGHHFDDVIETILMGMIYGGQAQTMMPKLHSANYEGMQLIRPMYFIRENDIKHWCNYNDLHFLQCACRFTEACAASDSAQTLSKRQEIKALIAELKKGNPQIEQNIFRSVENVNLQTLISYKDKDGKIHHFQDDYID
ncbi:MAG: ATPase [Ruminococcus sp.]|nr:ATPase [Ruminococcus sp.]